MILEDINGKAQTNANNVHTVKIEANATMFELLSSRLYSDKPMAVLRELSTNAVDAQIANGCTTPFRVHLPTRLEPYVSIRDFGIGMDNETVIDLYGTMGASSKRNSNAYNGALGVGSKSPFAYTAGSAFVVTSFFNGTKTTYSVFADNGIPSIAELGSMPTNEPNGIDVSVPVQVQDIQKFVDAAKKLYRFFQLKPEVNLELDLNLGNVLYEGDNWKLYDKSFEPMVVMANVGYPLDRSQVSMMPIIQTNGLVIYADTGSVQFAASREALSYTPSTMDKLREFEKKITADLVAQVNLVAKKYENKLIDLATALSALPHQIRMAVRNQKFNDYLATSGFFEIYNKDFKFLLPNSYNHRSGSYSSISGSLFKDKTIILADSLPAATALGQHLKPKAIIIAYNKLLVDFGGKAEALKQLKAFADLLGRPYVLATEESLKVFGATPTTTRASKGAVATNLMYRASGFSYNPKHNNSYVNIQYNSIMVNSQNKPMTIGVPIYNNQFMQLDYETALNAGYTEVYKILKHIKYPTAVNVVGIPKTHKDHLVNTIDLFTFLKSLGNVTIDVVTDELIRELSSKNWDINYIPIHTVPNDLASYIKESQKVSHAYKIVNNDDANRAAKAFKSLGVPVNVNEYKLTASSQEAHEKYKPLDICRIYSSDPSTITHFAKLAHAIDTTHNLRSNNVSSKSNPSD